MMDHVFEYCCLLYMWKITSGKRKVFTNSTLTSEKFRDSNYVAIVDLPLHCISVESFAMMTEFMKFTRDCNV